MDPWGDEETKNFYVDLPDLRIFLPNYAPKQTSVSPEEPPMTEEALDMDIDATQLIVDEATVSEEVIPKEDSETVVPDESSTSTAQPQSTERAPCTKQQFESFLHNLANCVNKELIDSAAIEFLLNLNSKHNRKKLTATVFGVQR